MHAPRDVVVSSLVTGGDFQGQPVVNWRVLQGPQGWKIVDVQAQGVWLAVVEQQDFTSTLANSGGNVGVLTSQLRRQVQGGPRSRCRSFALYSLVVVWPSSPRAWPLTLNSNRVARARRAPEGRGDADLGA